ncbi:MAG: hypothetical protein EXR72_19200 [Myxococcales bacterium]|nr:hypothetical protein [Myxococcales bacterium]
MKIRLALLLAVAACSEPPWRAPSIEVGAAGATGTTVTHALRRAASEREWRFEEALHPGTLAARRRRHLAEGTLAAFRDQGERLFSLDAPWQDAPARPVTPLHVAGGPRTPDATRCRGCHDLGGAGGSGRYSDLAYFDAVGDDTLSARRRLPRMLAGAALLDLAARSDGGMHPFGWAVGRARSLREMVGWSLQTHLGAAPSEIDDQEVDALATYIALLPPPISLHPRQDSLALRAQEGAELFREIGCAGCHSPSLPVADPVLQLSGGRRIDLSPLLSSDGRAPYRIHPLSDLRPHAMGEALSERGDDHFITTPLWGVASRGPFLHDGRAGTLEDAIVAHGGEAAPSRDAYRALGERRSRIQLFLLTQTRPPVLQLTR